MVFFAEEVDNVTFGVQGSNVAETMQISSTTDDVYMRFYTNNFSDVENLYTGAVIGSSNYDKSGSNKANLYFGQILSDENASTITRTMTISSNSVDIAGDMSIYGHIRPSSNIAFDLGSSAMRFRDLYLAGNTIHLGETAITETSEGRITIQNIRGERELDIDSLTTTNASSNISLDGKNLVDISLMNTASFKTNSITTDSASGINMSGITLSNIGVVDTVAITNSAGPNINIVGKSLSNITTVETTNLTAPNAGTINLTGSTLSNISTVQTTTLTGLNGKLDLSANTLSNIGSVVMNPSTTIYTDQMQSSSGSTINFLGTDLVNIRDLNITGDIRARGEFYVLNTTTCNTNQFRIDNDGTGPALIANQQGYEDIIQVQDDGNTVFFIKDGGQAAFGSFGTEIDASIPLSQVYIRNSSYCNTTALYVEQDNGLQDILILRGSNESAVIVADQDGRFGIGTAEPTAQLHVVGTDPNESALLVDTTTGSPALSVAADTGYVGIGVTDATSVLQINGGSTSDPLMTVSSTTEPNAFTMNADGTIGIGTAPVAGQTMTIAGTVNIENLIIGSADSDALLTAYGMQAPAGRDFLLFGDNSFSNVTDVYADRIALEGRGTATDPVYTFRPDQNTGMFSPAEDVVALTTAGTERLRVTDIGNVGIGTQTADVKLAVYGSDAMLIPSGTTAQRPGSAQAGYVRYNTELQTFEGFGPGNEWGSLGGVKSTDQQTYITAELSPGTNDDIIRFFNNGTESARFDANGHLGIGTTAADVSLTIEGTDAVMLPAGTISERPAQPRQGYVRYNTETLQFEGFGAGDTWGSLGGVKSVDQKTYISAEVSPGVSDDTLRFYADDSLLMTVSHVNNNSNLTFYGTDTQIYGSATISQIQLNARSLCNVSTLHTETITSTAAAIDFTDKALSNVNRVITQKLTGPTAAGIDAEGTTLSNLSTLEVDNITTDAAGGLINMSYKTLSNLNAIEVQNITSADPTKPNINISGNSLSNITTVATANVVTTVLTSTQDNINVDGKSLSNITTVETANLTSFTNAINVSAKSLSNVGDIWMKQNETVYTDIISATSGANGTIGFNNNNLTNINDLTIQGKFTVVGEFNVVETTTSNTSQMVIDNDGTGPALVVNQHGSQDILQVMDDTKVVMYIKDGGNMAIGDFGTPELPDPIPDAQLYVYNNPTDNQPAVYVKQEFTTQHTMVLSGSGPGGSNVVFSSYGKLGFGNDAPNARIHAVHRDTVTQFMKYESTDSAHAFVVGADGRVGVGADPNAGTNVFNAVTISGTTQTDSLVAKTDVRTNVLTTDSGSVINVSAKTLSNVDGVHINKLTTENASGVINVDFKSLSNINKLSLSNLEATAINIDSLTVDSVLTDSASGINFNNNTLSNIDIVDTNKLTNTRLSHINVDDKTLSNVKSVETHLLTSQTLHIGVDGKSLSNVKGMDVTYLYNASGLSINGTPAGTINFSDNILTNINTVSTINLTSPEAHIDVSNKSLCNVSVLEVDTIRNDASFVNFDQNTLSNVGTLRTLNIASATTQSHINFTDATLSNVGAIDVPRIENKDTSSIDFVDNTLSNVGRLDVNVITNLEGASIDMDSKALSNVGSVRMLANSVLETNTITTTDGRANIDMSTRTLSNLTTVHTGTVSTSKIATTAAGGVIDVDSNTLSNVSTLSVATIKSTAAGSVINMSFTTLSNVFDIKARFVSTGLVNGSGALGSNIFVVGSLSNVTTVDLVNLTTHTAGGLINVSDKTLSNVHALDTANITSTTTAAVQFSGKGLSNIGDFMLNADSTLKANTITTTDGRDNIDMSARTLSNITTVEAQTATVNKLTTSSLTDLIDVDAKTLSNVDTMRTRVLTAELASGVIDVDASTLSNVATLELTNLTTVAAGGLINVSGKSLSNVEILEVQTFANATDAHFDFSGLSLSNVNTISTTKITTDAQNIDVDAKTLSNVSVLELATLTTTAAGGLINVDGKSLSNMTTLEVANLTSYTEAINVSGKSLSNVSDMWMVPDKTFFVDRLSATAGAGPSNTIMFSGNDLAAIHDLTITGKLTVAGDFTVMETTTSNTNQMRIDNDGTGPALIVNQQGANDVLKVTDDDLVVMQIKDGGNMALGNFGLDTLPVIPDARMYVYNTTAAQPALYVEQDNATQDTLVLVGSAAGTSNVVFSGEGKLGMGPDGHVPAARIDVVHGDAETQFIHYSSQSTIDAFVVGADGRLGVLADPMASANLTNAVTVSGTTQTDSLVAKTDVRTNVLTTDSGSVIDVSAKTLSNVNMLEVMTITTTNAENLIMFANKSLSNIDKLYVNSLVAGSQDLDSINVNSITTDNPSGVDVSGETLSNVGAIDVLNLTSTTGSINLTSTSLSNIGYVETSTIISQTQNINFTTLTLSNIDTVETQNVTSTTGSINFTTTSLSNVGYIETSTITSQTQNINLTAHTLSNIDTVETQNLTSTTGSIDLTSTSLSNIGYVETSTITAQTQNIDFTDKTLSNINTLEVASITTMSAGGLIDMTGTTLSNLSVLEVDTITTTAAGGIINVDGKTLSNVTTLEVSNLTTADASGVINVTGDSLSNINVVSFTTAYGTDITTSTITVTTVDTTSASGIDFSANTLSNIAVLDTQVLTYSMGPNIDVDGKTLSNISTLSISTLTSPTSTVNVDYNTLSNVNVLEVQTITNATADQIDFTNLSLSNVAILQTVAIDSMGAGAINVSGTSLSNVDTVYTSSTKTDTVSSLTLSNVTYNSMLTMAAGQTLQTNTIDTTSGTVIDVSSKTMSNLTNVDTSIVTVTTLDTRAAGDNIDVAGNTLSNVNVLDVATLTYSAGPNIALADGKTLSNVGTLEVTRITSAQGVIDMTDVSLSNVCTIVMNPDCVLNTDKITSSAGLGIDFTNQDVTNINNLTVNGDINVRGEFFVMNTTTCNTNQFQVDNDGTGPALIVNQAGQNDILNVTDDGTTVMYVQDGGYVGFGEYDGIPLRNLTTPEGRVIIENPATSESAALVVYQLNDAQAAVKVYADPAVETPTMTIDTRGVTAPSLVTDKIDSVLTGQTIDCSATMLSNVDGISVAMITHPSGMINMDNVTLSNLGNISLSNLKVDHIGPLTAGRAVDFTNSTLSNIGHIQLSSVSAPTVQGDINFNFSRVLDVDSIIVRSNVTVMMTGTNTFTNLPTDVVRLNPSTNKIYNSDLSAEVVRLDTNTGAINPAILPPVDTYRKTLMHTKDRVGIGLKNPQQKLHVHGNQVITSGRLGIGTTEPRAMLDIIDNNGPATTIRIEQQGTVDILDIRAAANAPVIFAGANRSVGIHTSAPNSLFALDVQGKVNAATSLRTPIIESDTGDIDFSLTNLNGILSASIHNLVVSGSIVVPPNSIQVDGSAISMSNFATDLILTSVDTTNFDNTINFNSTKLINLAEVRSTAVKTSSITSAATTIECTAAMHVKGFDQTLLGVDSLDAIYGTQVDAEIGLRVDKNILSPAFLSISDRRIKTDVEVSSSHADLDTLMKIPVTRYKFIDGDGRRLPGFIAQEVEEHAPFAVRTTTGVVPNIMRTPSAIHTEGTVVELVEHGLTNASKQAPINLKVLIDGADIMTQVVEIISPNSFRVNKPLLGETVFIYGTVVPDFKLLDSDRLVPLVFNAVKELHTQQAALKETLASVLARLDALESRTQA